MKEDAGRSPRGERGLKHLEVAQCGAVSRRSPRGERGLKLYLQRFIHHDEGSLPTRGAWIETKFTL